MPSHYTKAEEPELNRMMDLLIYSGLTSIIRKGYVDNKDINDKQQI
jgi:hypothetical protein